MTRSKSTFYRTKTAFPLNIRCFTSFTNPGCEISYISCPIAFLMNCYLTSSKYTIQVFTSIAQQSITFNLAHTCAVKNVDLKATNLFYIHKRKALCFYQFAARDIFRMFHLACRAHITCHSKSFYESYED